jgi:hypothetical protein
MPLDYQAVRAAIVNAIAESDETGSYSPQQIDDIAFHMTDWLGELEDFATFCANPSSYSTEEVIKILMAFLYHVPNHIAAAAKQYLDSPVRDIFGVGAVASTPPPGRK